MAKQMTKTHHGKKQQFLNAMKGMPTIGAVITWHPGDKEQTHTSVKSALKHANLDESVAGERRPRDAFSRACKILEDERVIALFKEEGSELVYQFTGVVKDNQEIRYKKETFVRINKITGKVKCVIDTIEKFAQTELDRNMEIRTTADITKIVQKLFDKQADKDNTMLFSIRDQGGAYYVAEEFMGFVNQVQSFLNAMGGDVRILPIANTPTGQQSVTDIVETGLNDLVEDLQKAVESFGINTQQSAMERTVEKIKQSKVRIQAHASYLGNKVDELKDYLDKCDKALVKRIDEITKAKDKRRESHDKEPTRPVDAWGSTIGSNNNLVNVILNGTPKTMKELMEEGKLSDTVYEHLKKMVAAGRVVKTDKGFRLAPNEKGCK